MLRRGIPALVATAVLLPEALGLARTPPWPILVAFRRRLALGAALPALLLSRRRGWARGVLGVAATALALSTARHRRAGVSTAAMLTLDDGNAATTTRDLTVLAANVWLGRADPSALAAIIRTERPDVVVLPEAGDRFRKRLLDVLEGYHGWSCAPGRAEVEAAGADEGPSLTMLVADGAGETDVHPASSDTLSGWIALDLGGVRVVGVHPAVLLPRRTPDWVREHRLLGPLLADPEHPTVVLGDLNATPEHGLPGRVLTAGAPATWPANRPRWIGVTIDHVLASGPVSARSVEVLDVPGSDHRAVLARLVVGMNSTHTYE
ncbi:endonuclease/exonuclease/phosphatase family protein [Actinomycetospora atypica]|uniref:Endonuclease/exonuclease/phosphatase family protein n=1 Tax=Actinomycetospora atypica TaxID=1290095 RepID=A0ABV9YFX6_9PSEU